jgi:hypothetical protein
LFIGLWCPKPLTKPNVWPLIQHPDGSFPAQLRKAVLGVISVDCASFSTVPILNCVTTAAKGNAAEDGIGVPFA